MFFVDSANPSNLDCCCRSSAAAASRQPAAVSAAASSACSNFLAVQPTSPNSPTTLTLPTTSNTDHTRHPHHIHHQWHESEGSAEWWMILWKKWWTGLLFLRWYICISIFTVLVVFAFQSTKLADQNGRQSRGRRSSRKGSFCNNKNLLQLSWHHLWPWQLFSNYSLSLTVSLAAGANLPGRPPFEAWYCRWRTRAIRAIWSFILQPVRGNYPTTIKNFSKILKLN